MNCAKSYASEDEAITKKTLERLFTESPIPVGEQLSNLGLFIKRQSLSRILFMHELYQKILPVHGVIMDLGTRWGHNMALFSSFRGIYEPYNYNRKIIGFDTFSGFPHTSAQDGHDSAVAKGEYNVTKNYEAFLSELLVCHEEHSPLSHIVKHDIVKGDVCSTVPDYLVDHPETIVALAYFDFDLYTPTKTCLEALKPHLTKGSILAFDELNWPAFPGETLALKEVLGLGRFAIQRTPHNPGPSYIVIE